MTTLLAGLPAAPPADRPATLLDFLSAEEPTLEAVLREAWEGLAVHRAVPCPVCGAEMSPEYGAHAHPLGGTCGGCGSSLR